MMKKPSKNSNNTLFYTGAGFILLFASISIFNVLKSDTVSSPRNTVTANPAASPKVVMQPKTVVTQQHVQGVPTLASSPLPIVAPITSAAVPSASSPLAQSSTLSSAPSVEKVMPVLAQMPKAAPPLPGVRKPLRDPDYVEPVKAPASKAKPKHQKVVQKVVVQKPVVKNAVAAVSKPAATPSKAGAHPATASGSGSDFVPKATPSIGVVKEVVPATAPVADVSIKYDLKSGKVTQGHKPVPIMLTSTAVWVKLDDLRTVKVVQGESVDGLGVFQGNVDGKAKFNGQLLPVVSQ